MTGSPKQFNGCPDGVSMTTDFEFHIKIVPFQIVNVNTSESFVNPTFSASLNEAVLSARQDH